MRYNPKHQTLFSAQTRTLAVCAVVVIGLALPRASLAVGEIGFELTGYTDNATFWPTFYCEESIPEYFPFNFVNSNVEYIGTIGRNDNCVMTSVVDPYNSFNLLVGSSQETPVVVEYTVNTATESISGNTVLGQNAIFFSGNSQDYIVNYGVSDLPEPIIDQAYLYVGYDQSRWMQGLIEGGNADIKLADMVLPGAHDAGMFLISNVGEAVEDAAQICANSTGGTVIDDLLPGYLCNAGLLSGTALANVSLTQKDPIASQLKIGVRYFDIRPGYPKGGSESAETLTHVHNFIPGAYLAEMLSDMNNFLVNNPMEVVILRVKPDGIDSTYFSFIDQDTLTTLLNTHISSDEVGYQYVTSLSAYSDTTLQALANGGKRLLVQFGASGNIYPPINDSYGSGDNYEVSLTDPDSVISAIETTLLDSCSARKDYTILQLQDTGSAAIENYLVDIGLFPLSWADDLGNSDFGNILQGTKPMFDAATYAWLLQEGTLAGFKDCGTPVVLLNDFVDVALTSHAVGLSKYRHQNGK